MFIIHLLVSRVKMILSILSKNRSIDHKIQFHFPQEFRDEFNLAHGIYNIIKGKLVHTDMGEIALTILVYNKICVSVVKIMLFLGLSLPLVAVLCCRVIMIMVHFSGLNLDYICSTSIISDDPVEN